MNFDLDIAGHSGIFNNAKYLTNLEILNLDCNKEKIMKIDNQIEYYLWGAMNENLMYLTKLKEIYLECKKGNKIGNAIGDDGCFEIFINSKYLSNLEKLDLLGNRD